GDDHVVEPSSGVLRVDGDVQLVVGDADFGKSEPLPAVHDVDEAVGGEPLGHPQKADRLRVVAAVAAQQHGQVSGEQRLGGQLAAQVLGRDREDVVDLVEEVGVHLLRL